MQLATVIDAGPAFNPILVQGPYLLGTSGFNECYYQIWQTKYGEDVIVLKGLSLIDRYRRNAWFPITLNYPLKR